MSNELLTDAHATLRCAIFDALVQHPGMINVNSAEALADAVVESVERADIRWALQVLSTEDAAELEAANEKVRDASDV